MLKVNFDDLLGHRIGHWMILAFEGVKMTAWRGIRGGVGKGPAKRAFWLVECVCGHRETYPTYRVRSIPRCKHCKRTSTSTFAEELARLLSGAPDTGE